MYGSIRELIQNRTYFYSGYHSHWTEEGRRVISDLMDLYGAKIDQAVKQADEDRAKKLVLDELKKENT